MGHYQNPPKSAPKLFFHSFATVIFAGSDEQVRDSRFPRIREEQDQERREGRKEDEEEEEEDGDLRPPFGPAIQRFEMSQVTHSGPQDTSFELPNQRRSRLGGKKKPNKIK